MEAREGVFMKVWIKEKPTMGTGIFSHGHTSLGVQTPIVSKYA